jgi:hypothetical protein
VDAEDEEGGGDGSDNNSFLLDIGQKRSSRSSYGSDRTSGAEDDGFAALDDIPVRKRVR